MDGLVDVAVRMAALIALGAAWRWLQPGGLSGDRVRSAVGALVYYLLLPALVVDVLWGLDLGLDSVRISLTGVTVVATGWGMGWLAARWLALPDPRGGALMLAAAFPNATYMGLPALDAALGPVGRGVAIQFDYFACTPLLLTVGVVMAQAYGGRGALEPAWLRLARVPPFWAALAGVVLNATAMPRPTVVAGLLGTMGSAVVPLMLIVLGMSLAVRALDRETGAALVPALAIQLALAPLVAWALTAAIGLGGPERVGAVLEAAMPSMVLGVVLCDRYGLDARFYALVVTTSTLLALVTLPLWLYLLT